MERLTRDQKLTVTNMVVGLLSATVLSVGGCVVSVAVGIAPGELRQAIGPHFGLEMSPVASPTSPPRVDSLGSSRSQATGVSRKVHRSAEAHNPVPSRSSAHPSPAKVRVRPVVATPTPAPSQPSRADWGSAHSSPLRETAPPTTREASENTPPRHEVVRTDAVQKVRHQTDGSILSGPNIRSPDYKDDGAEFGSTDE